MNQCAREDAPVRLNIYEGYKNAEHHYTRYEHHRVEDRILKKVVLRLSGRKVPRQMPYCPDESQQQRAPKETEPYKKPVECIAPPAEFLVERAGDERQQEDEEYIQKEMTNAFPRVQCLEITPEHMTGKHANGS